MSRIEILDKSKIIKGIRFDSNLIRFQRKRLGSNNDAVVLYHLKKSAAYATLPGFSELNKKSDSPGT